MRLLLICAGLLLASAVGAQPKAFTAEYEARRNGEVLGKATLVYSPKADRAEFVTRISGTAGLAALAGVDIEERSTLRWSPSGPETIDYRFLMKAAWKTRERTVSVDRAAGRVVSTDKDRRHEFAYQPGVLDRHALTLALMFDVARGRRGELAYPVADREHLEQRRFRVGPNIRLRTALGSLPAVRVERLRDAGDGKKTRIWLARDRGYLPLRILQTEANGDSLDLRITAIR